MSKHTEKQRHLLININELFSLEEISALDESLGNYIIEINGRIQLGKERITDLKHLEAARTILSRLHPDWKNASKYLTDKNMEGHGRD